MFRAIGHHNGYILDFACIIGCLFWQNIRKYPCCRTIITHIARFSFTFEVGVRHVKQGF